MTALLTVLIPIGSIVYLVDSLRRTKFKKKKITPLEKE